jgi:GNAT superfamily N-acetyltransferase
MEVEINRATEKDISLISELAKKIWNDHYIDIISQQQIDFMLEKMYSISSITDQLNELNHHYYIIYLANTPIGFLSISSLDKEIFSLNKFYILSGKQKIGIGTIVFNKIIQKLINPKTIFLTVNRANYKSINFYFKNGFIIKKVEDFNIGEGYFMNDFVMVNYLR